jgi:hypothetical protein
MGGLNILLTVVLEFITRNASILEQYNNALHKYKKT